MSYAVKEPTYIIGYNLNPYAVGFHEHRRSNDKSKIEKELNAIKKMTAKKKAEIFECTEIQAGNMIITMISIFPGRCVSDEIDVNDDEDEKDGSATSESEDEKQ